MADGYLESLKERKSVLSPALVCDKTNFVCPHFLAGTDLMQWPLATVSLFSPPLSH